MSESPKILKPTLQVSADRMSAVLMLPPTSDEHITTYDQCFTLLQNHNVDVTSEVDAALKAVLKRHTNDPSIEYSVEIARGVPPIDGQDGRLEFREGYDPDHVVPVEAPPDDDEDHQVDYYNRHVFCLVKEGDLIGRLIEPVDGVPGRNICNEDLAPQPARPCSTKIDEESILMRANGSLIAQISGVLSRHNDVLRVSPDLEIPGYVDFSTGHVKFNGDIIVHKGVRDCFLVSGSGSITVHKMVEAATLKAGLDLFLKGGMAAREKGTLQVGRHLEARYLDNVDGTIAGDAIIAKEVINCRLRIGGAYKGERSVISGGEIFVGGSVDVAEIGAESGVATHIIIGGSPEVDAVKPSVDEVLAQVRQRKEKLRPEYEPLRKIADKLTQEQQNRYRDLKTALRYLDELTKRVRAATADLQKVANRYAPISVTVHSMIHPGAVITLGENVAEFNNPISGPLLIQRDSKGDLVIEDLQRKAAAPLTSFAMVTSASERAGGRASADDADARSAA